MLAVVTSEPAQVDRDDFDLAVHAVVRSIPPGRVMSYGDVAEYLGRGGPRQVGAVMASSDGALPWWRVIRADGSPPPGHERECLAAQRAEGTPMRPDGTRVDMSRARWDGR
jgi:alkylated DNA nucleotide flippase Atl1